MADLEKLKDGSFRVNVGSDPIIVSKLYGPHIFADLTIKAMFKGDEEFWLVMRADKEWCRIPAQIDGDFDGVEE